MKPHHLARATHRLAATCLAIATLVAGCGGGGSAATSTDIDHPSTGQGVPATPAKELASRGTDYWRLGSIADLRGRAAADAGPQGTVAAWFTGDALAPILNLGAFRAGSGWSVDVHPVADPVARQFVTDRLAVAVDTTGSAVVAWRELEVLPSTVVDRDPHWFVRSRAYSPATGWGLPETVVESSEVLEQLSAGALGSGRFALVWKEATNHRDGSGHVVSGEVVSAKVQAAVRSSTGWQLQTVGTQASGNVEELSLAASEPVARALWVSASTDGSRQLQSSSADGSGLFGAPQILSATATGSLRGLAIATTANASAIAMWRQPKCDGSAGAAASRASYEAVEVCVATAQGTSWSSAGKVGATEQLAGSEMQSSIVVGADGDALLAWNERLPAQQRLWLVARPSAGSPWGTAKAVSTTETLTPPSPQLLRAASADFRIVWINNRLDNTIVSFLTQAKVDGTATLSSELDVDESKDAGAPLLLRSGDSTLLGWSRYNNTYAEAGVFMKVVPGL